MTPPSRKILIVAYHFPPDAAVGALRPLKFAKYLPHYGWEPWILTVKPSYYEKLDESRSAEIPAQSRVFRTNVLPHPNTVYKHLKRSYYAITGRKQEFGQKLRESPPEGDPQPRRILSKARKFLSSLLWIPPDDVLGWLPIAAARAIRLVRAHRITHIYTTNPPHTTHLVGLAIKATCNVRWVADFRDLWLFEKPFQTRTAERVEHWMERKVVENADAIVSTTDRMADKFRRTYPAVSAERFVTICNGFDGDDFSSIVAAGNSEKFTLTYLGSFYDERTPEHLLTAVSELIVGKQIPIDALEIQLIGHCRYVKGRSTDDIAASLGLSSVVRVIDPVPYKRALEYAVNSHLLVLLAPDQPYEIPGKAYEYLASGVDVLALTEEGATADLIRKTGGGVVLEPKDIVGIRAAVLEHYVKWTIHRSGLQRRASAGARMYERRELTGKLVSVLDSRT
jgi:hypothetical protein